MDDENELKEYCHELEENKVKVEPIEYDVNIDDKKIVLDAVQNDRNVKLEEFDDKKHIRNHEASDAEDCIVSCKVEVEENYVYVHEFNQDYNMKDDALLVTQNIKGANGDMRKIYINGHMLDKHVETGEKRYKCPKCEYKTNNKYYLKRHEVVHEDARLYECEICNKQFKRAYSLKVHLFVHDEEKRYQCAHCDYRTKRKWLLVVHLNNKHMETRKKRYKCPKCEYKTNNRQGLKQHAVVHEDARPYECEICNKQFKRADYLKSHRFVHKEERRYQCAHCDFKTKTKRPLEKHLKNVHLGLKSKEYECSKCTFKTVYSNALKRHFRKHLENVEEQFMERPLEKHLKNKHLGLKSKEHECSKCTFKTIHSYALERHFRKHLKNVEEETDE